MATPGEPLSTSILAIMYFGDCLAAFSFRAAAIVFDIRMGPPGQFISLGKPENNPCRARRSAGPASYKCIDRSG
jgi:hypothetical protein